MRTVHEIPSDWTTWFTIGVMMTLEHDGEHRCSDAARSNAKDRSRLSFRSDQGIREASATVAPADTGPILALQRAYGNRAVQRLLHGNSAHSGTVERRVPNLQRQPVPVVPAVGLALSAASFVATNRPAGTDAFGNNNVSFRYARDQPGPREPTELRTTIFELDTAKSFGSSSATLSIILRYDGQNIVSAFTEQQKVSGYEGGTFGSEAAVNFSAVQRSQPTETVASAYVMIQGFNNPSGPGFQRFRARILVTGEGKIEPVECQLSEGEGVVRTSPWCFVGFSDLHKGYSPVEPEPLPPDLSGAGLPSSEPLPPPVGVPAE